jgi:hypothetical protein
MKCINNLDFRSGQFKSSIGIMTPYMGHGIVIKLGLIPEAFHIRSFHTLLVLQMMKSPFKFPCILVTNH